MYLLSIFTKILHFLPEEISHNIALKALKISHSLGLLQVLIGSKLSGKKNSTSSNDIRSFNNKLGIAAGLDKDGEYIDCLAALGIGFIEVGTVTPRKQPGNPKPRLFRNKKDKSLVNRLGFNNQGVDSLVKNLKYRKSTIPVGVSIGKNFNTPNEEAYKDYLFCMDRVYEYSNYIAINISSPNTKDLRALSNQELLKNLLFKIKERQKKLSKSYEYVPIFLKISPDESFDDLKDICSSIIENELDGIICTNTTINHDHNNGYGGLSGLPLKNIANEKLIFIKKIVGSKIQIIASGGVMSAKDYKEKINGGADLVQIYTGFIFYGPKLIQDILNLDSP